MFRRNVFYSPEDEKKVVRMIYQLIYNLFASKMQVIEMSWTVVCSPLISPPIYVEHFVRLCSSGLNIICVPVLISKKVHGGEGGINSKSMSRQWTILLWRESVDKLYQHKCWEWALIIGLVDQVSDVNWLRLLYHELKKNILDARYPLDQAKCDNMAGLQAAITEREKASEDGPEMNQDYFR